MYFFHFHCVIGFDSKHHAQQVHALGIVLPHSHFSLGPRADGLGLLAFFRHAAVFRADLTLPPALPFMERNLIISGEISCVILQSLAKLVCCCREQSFFGTFYFQGFEFRGLAGLHDAHVVADGLIHRPPLPLPRRLGLRDGES